MQIVDQIRARLSDEHADDGRSPILYPLRILPITPIYLYTRRIGPIDIGVTYNSRL